MHVGVGRRCLLFTLCLFVPCAAHAQVVISEFLYDAPGSDTGQEWVELCNTGSAAVDLTKWKINDGSNHLLNVPPKNGGIGSITLAPGALIILADNAPNIEALYPALTNVIDTTLSLPNTSGTISLIDDEGSVADTLSYTKDTGGTGDGNTLQRVSLGGTALLAASPSPGSGDCTGSAGTTTQTTTNTATTQTQSSTPPPVSSYVAPPVPSLFADAGSDRSVIVGADTQFDARAYDRNTDIVETARFLWNFGDGSTAEGESVLHHYSYPGRYALVLNIAQDKFAAMDEVVVTAEPAKLAFTPLPDNGVEIRNLSGHDLDLSGWLVRAGPGLLPALFTLPPHSIILSGASMYITRATLGFRATAEAQLQYPNGVVALEAGQSSATTTPSQAKAVSNTPAPPPISAAHVSVSIQPPQPVQTDESQQATATAQVAAAGTVPGNRTGMWWVLTGILAVAAGGALIAARRIGRNEWNIIEEKGE